MRRDQEAWKDPDAADSPVLLLGDSPRVPSWVWSVIGGRCPPLPLRSPHPQCDPEPVLDHLALLQPLPSASPSSKIHPAPDLPSEEPEDQRVASPSPRTRWWYGVNRVRGRGECKPPCPICTPNCTAAGGAEQGSEHPWIFGVVFCEGTWLMSGGAPPSLMLRLRLEVPQAFSRRASPGLTLLLAPAFL